MRDFSCPLAHSLNNCNRRDWAGLQLETRSQQPNLGLPHGQQATKYMNPHVLPVGRHSPWTRTWHVGAPTTRSNAHSTEQQPLHTNCPFALLPAPGSYSSNRLSELDYPRHPREWNHRPVVSVLVHFTERLQASSTQPHCARISLLFGGRKEVQGFLYF